MLFKMDFRFLPTAVYGKIFLYGKIARYATNYHREKKNNGNIQRNTRHMFYLVATSNEVLF